jgi:hypothetical protein
MKEATTNAWKSYESSENVFIKSWNVAVENYSNTGFDHYKEVTLGELDHFKSDLKRILETKNLDPSLVSLLQRRLEARQKWEDKYRKHLDNYEKLDKTITDETEKTNKLNAEVDRFFTEVKDLDERFTSEIEEFCKSLTEKYSYNFSPDSLRWYKQQKNQNVTTNNNNRTDNGNTNSGTDANANTATATVDMKMLVGTWKSESNVLYQYDDGRMYYYFSNGDSTYGSWQIYNNQLYHYYNQFYGAGNRFVYNLGEITANSFTVTLVDSPYTRFNFVK